MTTNVLTFHCGKPDARSIGGPIPINDDTTYRVRLLATGENRTGAGITKLAKWDLADIVQAFPLERLKAAPKVYVRRHSDRRLTVAGRILSLDAGEHDLTADIRIDIPVEFLAGAEVFAKYEPTIAHTIQAVVFDLAPQFRSKLPRVHHDAGPAQVRDLDLEYGLS